MSNNGLRRVVVTGMGAISPLGCSVATLWRGLLEGKSGVRRLEWATPGQYSVSIGASVPDFDPTTWIDRKEARRLDRFAQFALAATQQALSQADLRIDDSNAEDIGVIFGSAVGGLTTLYQAAETLINQGPKRVSPLTVPLFLTDIAAGQIAIRTGAQGPNFCVTSACATGNQAIGEAFETLRRGAAVAMIAGASEAGLIPLGLASFHRVGALSTRNDDPKHASRPFDRDRDGFVFGEGAGALVLEELEFARRRGARILAEVVGYGCSADAFHVSAPDATGRGAALSMQRALRSAGVRPDEIDYINAHGTSTPLNDKVETLAVKHVFGDHAYRVPISSTKSMIGHLLGAAGAVEAVVCVKTIEEGTIHPTVNYMTPDPECDLDYVPNKPRRAAVKIALSNAFGFGGHNATVILRAYEDD